MNTPYPAGNALLDGLPDADRRRLMVAGEAVAMRSGDLLAVAGCTAPYVVFPLVGFVSRVVRLESHPDLEVGMIGHEGVLGAHLVLGIVASPVRALVQGAGWAWRIETAVFCRLLGGSPSLQAALSRAVHAELAELAGSAACLRFHRIEARLARWLLMSHDRMRSDRFELTHEFMACMLGVRRASVTLAAGALQQRGVLTYRHGVVTLLDRPGLQAAACACYVVGNPGASR
jgi:CRP-like cAMP-binding protein